MKTDDVNAQAAEGIIDLTIHRAYQGNGNAGCLEMAAKLVDVIFDAPVHGAADDLHDS
ncbi:MAG: hypothetical protein L0Y67_06435 [Gammaproteobacteria bacterium]|nr:hypothetical protein [Gammaproteobacteria bacterium]